MLANRVSLIFQNFLLVSSFQGFAILVYYVKKQTIAFTFKGCAWFDSCYQIIIISEAVGRVEWKKLPFNHNHVLCSSGAKTNDSMGCSQIWSWCLQCWNTLHWRLLWDWTLPHQSCCRGGALPFLQFNDRKTVHNYSCISVWFAVCEIVLFDICTLSNHSPDLNMHKSTICVLFVTQLAKERGKLPKASEKHGLWGEGLRLHTKPWVRAR